MLRNTLITSTNACKRHIYNHHNNISKQEHSESAMLLQHLAVLSQHISHKKPYPLRLLQCHPLVSDNISYKMCISQC